MKKIQNALISVYYKDGLPELVSQLHKTGVTIYSTGGTKDFIQNLGIDVIPVESITGYPSILGGRVKTLHPKVFGGILKRSNNETDLQEIVKYEIPVFDMVVVDLYPFEETLKSGAGEDDIIEKIDIGGISLIRAAAKNFDDVTIVPSRDVYKSVINELEINNNQTTLEFRRKCAAEAFRISSQYDYLIGSYFSGKDGFSVRVNGARHLRYGENPHQKGFFFGNFDAMFEQLHGKEISYNNLLDIDAAVHLAHDFDEPVYAVIKHNNACGIAVRKNLTEAWLAALAGDPVSAFGGIIITNRPVSSETAEEINKIFFEIIIAPEYEAGVLEILKQKKNRIILLQKECTLPSAQYRSLLNGVIAQDKDIKKETPEELKAVTKTAPNAAEVEDLLFANILVKHTKSNAIVLAKNKQLLASGIGQTSRVDALKQAIEKARNFGFELKGAVMASDAFFPFADSVEIAHKAGIDCVIQPGGSVRDQETIDFCNNNNMKMVFTGFRHFKH